MSSVILLKTYYFEAKPTDTSNIYIFWSNLHDEHWLQLITNYETDYAKTVINKYMGKLRKYYCVICHIFINCITI